MKNFKDRNPAFKTRDMKILRKIIILYQIQIKWSKDWKTGCQI